MSDAPRSVPRSYHELAPALPESGLDLFELFPRDADIEMEIGFGRGLFLRQRCAAAPEAYLLGIEIKRKWAYRVAQRCQREALTRARVFAGDVRSALPGLRPGGALARVFIHFPDPWWTKRHQKRRLTGDATLDELARLLRPDGELFVQSDVEERAQEYLEQLARHPAFGPERTATLPDNPYGARSNREQRAIDDGLPIYRVLARRR
jgi:tRNA (guanine-N7-)-methyltransferase